MADVKWIKLDVNIFDNRKIRLLESMPEGSQLALIWLKLLCLAGQVNDNGMIYVTPDIAFTEQTLATMFNCSVTNINIALTAFEQFGMIEVVDNILHISNWERYQNIEGMEKLKQQRKEINKRYYEKHKLLESSVKTSCKTSYKTQQDTTDIDIDKNKNKTISKDIDIGKKRFTPPTIEEVQAYINEKNYIVDAERFINFYDANGWMVGKNKMKKWTSTLANWNKTELERREKERKANEDPFERIFREVNGE